MRDTVGMEQLGVPSVGLVQVPFGKLALMHARQLGMASAPLLIYPQDLPSKDPPQLVVTKARDVANELPRLLLVESPEPVTLG